MSRTKNIDAEQAIPAAMALFWKHGYHTLGTRQIEEETGITRFTLQTFYGGKFSLFLSTLDAYLDAFEMHAAPTMTDGNLDTIAAWFETRAEPAMFERIACYGCLMLNSTVEFLAENDEVNQRAERFYTMVRDGFRNALTAVKNENYLDADFNIDEMSEVLLGATIGVNIVIRSAASNAAGKNMGRSVASLVRGWEAHR